MPQQSETALLLLLVRSPCTASLKSLCFKCFQSLSFLLLLLLLMTEGKKKSTGWPLSSIRWRWLSSLRHVWTHRIWGLKAIKGFRKVSGEHHASEIPILFSHLSNQNLSSLRYLTIAAAGRQAWHSPHCLPMCKHQMCQGQNFQKGQRHLERKPQQQ